MEKFTHKMFVARMSNRGGLQQCIGDGDDTVGEFNKRFAAVESDGWEIVPPPFPDPEDTGIWYFIARRPKVSE